MATAASTCITILPRNLQPVAPPASTRVFLFPGQSSVGPEIVSRARRAHPAADRVAARARIVLGAARASIYLDGPVVRLASNRDIQIAVFLTTQMYLAALDAEGITAEHSLGLSLGEYSHLVHIGALDLDDALRLVDERGRCYDEAPQGVMATVLAVTHDVVRSVVTRALAYGPVVISNINASTQHVIAGSDLAVAWAAATLEDEHAAHVTIIERRVPMHSPLMAPVADAFRPALAQAPWRRPSRAYVPNVTGEPIAHASPLDFTSLLTRHVGEPVLWQSAMNGMVAAHGDAAFIEVGPGGVLHNMIGRAWRGTRRARVDAPDGIEPRAHFAATVEALGA